MIEGIRFSYDLQCLRRIGGEYTEIIIPGIKIIQYRFSGGFNIHRGDN